MNSIQKKRTTSLQRTRCWVPSAIFIICFFFSLDSVQNPTPGTIIPKIQTSAQTTPTPPPTTPTTQPTTPTTQPTTPTTQPTTPTTQPTTPTTQPTTPTTQPTTPTTQPTTPTTQPTTPTTQPTAPPTPSTVPSECGGGPRVLTGPSGLIETIGWPSSPYPVIADCSWDIVCPAGQKVGVFFENSFRVAGQMPDCAKDQLLVHDCDGSIQYGPFCHLTRPQPFTSTCNKVNVVFKANNERGASRTGFRMNYVCIEDEEPTTTTTTTTTTQIATVVPPTVLPSECGGGPGTLTDISGYIQTVGWPRTAYPLNTECSWNIVCPAGSKVEVSFDSRFRVAGQMPDCSKDQLKIFDCEGETLYGPFCHLARPRSFTSTCNKINIVFVSNKDRGSTRTGFRLNYRCSVEAPPTLSPTPPPTPPPMATIVTGDTVFTLPPQCGGGPQVRRDRTGVIQTLNWKEEAYPINTDCLWRVECPPLQRVKLIFHSSFRVAGAMPACTKDQLNIQACEGETYGPYCHLTAPRPIETSCNSVDISFRSGSERGSTRTGFRLNYICI